MTAATILWALKHHFNKEFELFNLPESSSAPVRFCVMSQMSHSSRFSKDFNRFPEKKACLALCLQPSAEMDPWTLVVFDITAGGPSGFDNLRGTFNFLGETNSSLLTETNVSKLQRKQPGGSK